MTTIQFTTNTTTLIETEETTLTFRFELSEPPPAGGIRVYLLGNVPQSLTQLDLFALSFTGGDVPQGDFDFSGFFFNITSQVATVTAPIFADGISEGQQTVVYTLQADAAYTVDPSFSAVTVNFYDDPSQVSAPPPVNEPPVAVNDSYTTNAGQQLVVNVANGVLSNDTDAQTDPLTATVVQAPNNGSLTLDANGSFTYTPNAEFTGTDSFTYLANDGKVNSTAATVSITVNAPVNDPPVAVNDSYTTNAGQQLVVNVANGVLSNDTDAQTDPLTATVVQAPNNGSLTLDANGSFTYTPNAEFTGTDSFTYLANDGKVNSTAATVSITVNAPVTKPTISFTASPNTLGEANNDSIVLTFQLSEPPPEVGLEVTFDSGVERSLSEFDVFSATFDGVQFLRANATSSAVTIRLLQQTATITLPLFKDEVAEDPKTFTYTLSPITDYDFVPGEDAITFTINDTSTVSELPVVGFTASPVVSEQDSPGLVLIFNTQGIIPAEGIIVSVGGDFRASSLAQGLQFEQRIESEGIEYLAFNSDTQAYQFRLTRANTNITIPVIDDIVEEADITYTYQLLPDEAYTIDSEAASANITYVDGVPGGVGPVVSISTEQTTIQEGDILTLNFSVDGEIPPEGLILYVLSPTSDPLGDIQILNTQGLADLPETDSTGNGFFVTLTQSTASLALQVLDDDSNQELETLIFNLVNGEQYEVNSDADGVTFTLENTNPSLEQISDTVFQIQGSNQPKLQISLLERNSDQVNELGVFVVDDDQGTINGIAPNSPGYAEAALDRAKVIFSIIADSPNGFNQTNLGSLIEFNSGDKLGFFLVKNSTIDAVLSGSTPESAVIFGQPSSYKVETSNDGSYKISWDDANGVVDFKDLVIQASASNISLPLGADWQANPQGELIDLQDITGQVRAEFILNREAAFDNLIGFYEVADVNGGIDFNGDGTIDFRPGDAGYTKAAIEKRIVGLDMTVNNQGTATFTTYLNGGSIYAPFIIANGKPDAILDNNSNNDPAVYFAFLGANPGKIDHIRLLGNNVWGFEDLPLGGDMDYNDVVIRANFNLI
ncbi:Ig-like domain-containing protein [Nodularia spumigena CS-591/04]|uniref:Ig-like domain-containing protein n=11 Tax=Cyanobacteriota TaxID=1117 RepID=UPI00232D4A1F|nr:Ig-like domain-containing protein [Nodularia spumigena]MDB9330632.1 Ig-like domain-containing protein [Nodularia spumigena CS-591/04]